NEELEERPSNLREELPAEPLLQQEVFLQLPENIGQTAGLLAHVDEGDEQPGKCGLLRLQGAFHALASGQFPRDAIGQRWNRERAPFRLLVKNMAESQTRTQIVAQNAAEFDQAGQG